MQLFDLNVPQNHLINKELMTNEKASTITKMWPRQNWRDHLLFLRHESKILNSQFSILN